MKKVLNRKSLRIRIALVATVFLLFSTYPRAQNFEDGVKAYLSGNYLKAYGIWKPLADQGGSVAMFNIGVLYAQGLGLERNDKIAFEWYRKSAEGGYAPAQFNFGTAYSNGKGVEKDDALAAKWWQAAADQGHLQAQYNLATLYYFGRGVRKDIEKAKSWYQKAADRGDQRAQKALATITKQSQKNVITPAKSAPTQTARQTQNKTPTNDPRAGRRTERLPKVTSTKTELKPTTTGKAKSSEQTRRTKVNVVQKQASELSANEDWIRQQKPNFYTVQLIADADERNIKKYILRHRIQDRAVYFKSNNARRPWYKVVYGSYSTAAEAKAAVRQLPQEVQKYTPWVRSFRTVHVELSSQNISGKMPTSKPVSKQKSKQKQVGRSSTTLKPAAKNPPQASPPQAKQQAEKKTKLSAYDKSFMLQKGQHAFNVQNYVEAQKYWLPLANIGVAEAQYGLGFMYESGWGVDKDFNTAAIWYTRAANQGHAKSQYNLGMLYILGQGVEQNNSLGIYWVQNAGDNNDKRAQAYLQRSRYERSKKGQAR